MSLLQLPDELLEMVFGHLRSEFKRTKLQLATGWNFDTMNMGAFNAFRCLNSYMHTFMLDLLRFSQEYRALAVPLSQSNFILRPKDLSATMSGRNVILHSINMATFTAKDIKTLAKLLLKEDDSSSPWFHPEISRKKLWGHTQQHTRITELIVTFPKNEQKVGNEVLDFMSTQEAIPFFPLISSIRFLNANFHNIQMDVKLDHFLARIRTVEIRHCVFRANSVSSLFCTVAYIHRAYCNLTSLTVLKSNINILVFVECPKLELIQCDNQSASQEDITRFHMMRANFVQPLPRVVIHNC
jgi:hypothetical protein